MDFTESTGTVNTKASPWLFPYFEALYNAPLPILIAKEDGRFLLINREVQQVTGYTAEHLPTISEWTRRLLENGGAPDAIRFLELFESETATFQRRLKLKTKGGLTLIWNLYNVPVGITADGQRITMIVASDETEVVEHQKHLEEATHRLENEIDSKTKVLEATAGALENEITERHHLGETLTAYQNRLRQMSKRILNVLEADRKTVSKELHDSIGASLAAIKFSLEDKEIKRQQNEGLLEDSLEQEISYLMSAIKETKRISANLRPTILDDLGLMATLKWYLRQYQRIYETIRVDFSTDIGEEDVSEAIKIIVYRIVQEGLSNAAKHSGTDAVRLHIGFDEADRTITLDIEDNGHGFDVKKILSDRDPLSGYGLTAMRERCEIFGGTFDIQSRIGVGTRIHAVLPSKDEKSGNHKTR